MREVSYEIVICHTLRENAGQVASGDNIRHIAHHSGNCSNNLVMILAPGPSSELNTDIRASDWSARLNTGL